ncbi:predicted protein [Thalassiosira pseudonana CCMP1335]|uniref:Helicase-associated domain-containing protein n=1 Tax=Thalassiosira pseudonana TaxID=35128 RepID=B8C900_THAPS|nr:predicted protein [Thalassiosira pseudonana CCMP1335]EED89765.1 predicted protein [Thalassiosira pseudonana CCMP1335]|eukprot:scaffold13320_cov215-Alexandrium_tamarense.AAC.8
MPTTAQGKRKVSAATKEKCLQHLAGAATLPTTDAKKRGRPRKADTEAARLASHNNNKDLPLPSLPANAIPFSTQEFPELSIDVTAEDHSALATAFTRPLFAESPSRALEIAYSHQNESKRLRLDALQKKNAVLGEYRKIKDKYMQKKLELSLANEELERYSQRTGAWTRKVFDLELNEDCEWNTNLRRLREFKEKNHRLPRSVTRAEGEEERMLAEWLEGVKSMKTLEEEAVVAGIHDEDGGDEEDALFHLEMEGGGEPAPKIQRTSTTTTTIQDYPHRISSLAELGVTFTSPTSHSTSPTDFESMFQKLLSYKEEMGTLRFPSEEQCTASGDAELIALQKWVKSQVLNFRYGKKARDPVVVKRFLDIGFSFDKWYAKPKGDKKYVGDGKKEETFDDVAKREVEGLLVEGGGGDAVMGSMGV